MNHRRLIATGFALLAASSGPALAHHSYAVYDMSAAVSLRGVVTKYEWEAPHGHIWLVAKADPAHPNFAGEWDVETAAPNILIRQGWNKLTLKAGDEVRLVLSPLKSGARGGQMQYAIVNGKILYNEAARPESAKREPEYKAPAP